MTDEVLLIVLAGAWLIVHVCAHGFAQWATAGNAWALGSRDEPPRETLLNRRLRRASANYLETLPAVLAVLIAAELSGRANELTTPAAAGCGSAAGWSTCPPTPLESPGFAASPGALRCSPSSR